jgi:hypothetical protein
LDADRDDAEGLAFRGIDLPDVRQLLVAIGQRVDRADLLMIEHLVEGRVTGDTRDAREGLVTLAAEPDQ